MFYQCAFSKIQNKVVFKGNIVVKKYQSMATNSSVLRAGLEV